MKEEPYRINNLALHIRFILDKETYPGWEDIRNLVNVHSLYWIHEGEGTFLTNTEHEVRAGMLTYLKPGLKLSMRSKPHSPLRMTMVLFDCAEFVYEAGVWQQISPIEKLRLPFLSQYRRAQAEEIGSMFHDIHNEWVAGIAVGETVAHPKMQMLLHKLHQNEEMDWNVADSGAFAAYEQVKCHIENRYKDNLRIEVLAEEYSISASYLRKIFVKQIGMGPKVYLNHLRNQQACRYLEFTDYPIKEIAKLCGYIEEFHFSKMFKQLNGTSPSNYRARHRQ
ncbi:AraC family transcriptional regulator [Paenibacillus sp. ACRRY]|uniref:helix-turn-helix transcriptional regulator n=1 Tax=Paenibacillus sp. ACRRY TaxID=2918208 RepID=UPI001EF65046|nr:AraC family transcriptional regulator [Paenibacillus sp. ACRRY]MCG7381216.1 AraC family transcriptional regulator [Paenibacillus sp. ACRRY]